MHWYVKSMLHFFLYKMNHVHHARLVNRPRLSQYCGGRSSNCPAKPTSVEYLVCRRVHECASHARSPTRSRSCSRTTCSSGPSAASGPSCCCCSCRRRRSASNTTCCACFACSSARMGSTPRREHKHHLLLPPSFRKVAVGASSRIDETWECGVDVLSNLRSEQCGTCER